MSPHPDLPVSRADLDAQTTQMKARFDAIMLLLEDHTKIKTDLHNIKEEVQLLRDTTDAFTSRLDHQETLITNFPSTDTTAIEQRLTTSLNNNITTAITTSLATDPIITSLIHDVRDLRTKGIVSTKKTGFSQPESKDFHASKLETLLAGIVLNGDSLLDLELFFDSILSKLESVTLTSSLYPKYKDLTITFDFKGKLCGLSPYPPLPYPDSIQALANYKSFGNSLRLFLLKASTIPSATCPETALQLLSLRKNSDGFAILQNLIFLRSPQLQGKFKDFRSMIESLQIIPGEHIREFYSRTETLGQEIDLAQLEDGSNAALSERFLSLLRDTNDPIIIGETSHAWKEIQSFHRDPKHLRKPLPWTFDAILRDLELARITILHPPIPPSSHPDLIDAHVAYGNRNQRNFLQHSMKRHPTQAIHTMKSGRRLISSPTLTTAPSQPRCKLCNNGHPNPWHTEETCPFKDPTHILCKTT